MHSKEVWLKRIATLCSIILIGILLLSTVFIAEEVGHHDCSGEDCPICETIEECINNMYICGFGVAVLTLIAAFTGIVRVVQECRKLYRIVPTPVTYKVRLDN